MPSVKIDPMQRTGLRSQVTLVARERGTGIQPATTTGLERHAATLHANI